MIDRVTLSRRLCLQHVYSMVSNIVLKTTLMLTPIPHLTLQEWVVAGWCQSWLYREHVREREEKGTSSVLFGRLAMLTLPRHTAGYEF